MVLWVAANFLTWIFLFVQRAYWLANNGGESEGRDVADGTLGRYAVELQELPEDCTEASIRQAVEAKLKSFSPESPASEGGEAKHGGVADVSIACAGWPAKKDSVFYSRDPHPEISG